MGKASKRELLKFIFMEEKRVSWDCFDSVPTLVSEYEPKQVIVVLGGLIWDFFFCSPSPCFLFFLVFKTTAHFERKPSQ